MTGLSYVLQQPSQLPDWHNKVRYISRKRALIPTRHELLQSIGNAREKITMSNKSESYRDLPDIFEVKSSLFRVS